jgi:hypothetical protein
MRALDQLEHHGERGLVSTATTVAKNHLGRSSSTGLEVAAKPANPQAQTAAA